MYTITFYCLLGISRTVHTSDRLIDDGQKFDHNCLQKLGSFIGFNFYLYSVIANTKIKFH